MFLSFGRHQILFLIILLFIIQGVRLGSQLMKNSNCHLTSSYGAMLKSSKNHKRTENTDCKYDIVGFNRSTQESYQEFRAKSSFRILIPSFNF